MNANFRRELNDFLRRTEKTVAGAYSRTMIDALDIIAGLVGTNKTADRLAAANHLTGEDKAFVKMLFANRKAFEGFVTDDIRYDLTQSQLRSAQMVMVLMSDTIVEEGGVEWISVPLYPMFLDDMIEEYTFLRGGLPVPDSAVRLANALRNAGQPPETVTLLMMKWRRLQDWIDLRDEIVCEVQPAPDEQLIDLPLKPISRLAFEKAFAALPKDARGLYALILFDLVAVISQFCRRDVSKLGELLEEKHLFEEDIDQMTAAYEIALRTADARRRKDFTVASRTQSVLEEIKNAFAAEDESDLEGVLAALTKCIAALHCCEERRLLARFEEMSDEGDHAAHLAFLTLILVNNLIDADIGMRDPGEKALNFDGRAFYADIAEVLTLKELTLFVESLKLETANVTGLQKSCRLRKKARVHLYDEMPDAPFKVLEQMILESQKLLSVTFRHSLTHAREVKDRWMLLPLEPRKRVDPEWDDDDVIDVDVDMKALDCIVDGMVTNLKKLPQESQVNLFSAMTAVSMLNIVADDFDVDDAIKLKHFREEDGMSDDDFIVDAYQHVFQKIFQDLLSSGARSMSALCSSSDAIDTEIS